MRISFVGPTYASRSNNIACDRSVNFYPEINQQDSKDVISLIGTPGTTYFTGTGTTVVRGMHACNNLMYIVAGKSLYSVNAAGTISAPLGTLSTQSGRVSMADNGLAVSGIGGNQLIIVDGTAGYIWNYNTSTFSVISGGGWPSNPAHVSYLDGYFILTCTGSMIAYCSNLYDGTTWGTLAVSPISASPDTVQTVADLSQQLWFIKQNTSECWYDAGVATAVGFPFARISAGVLDGGTSAPWSVARLQSTLFMLGNVRNNELGEFVGILQLANMAFTLVSPTAINYQISQWATLSDAFGYCYSEGGHSFYVVTSPSANQTFVYDVTTQMCHERSTYTNSPYAYGRHFSNCYCYFNGNHYVGDYLTGNIYKMSSDIYTDNGQPIISVRQAQHISDKKTLKNAFFNKLIIDAEGGIGIRNTQSSSTSITNTIVVDNFEYASDADAQAAYVSSDGQTSLLLHMDGTNGSTTFTDSSVNNYTVTAVGNAHIDTSVYEFPTGSGCFDGNGSYLTVPDSEDWYFGTGDFTIDTRVNFNNLSGDQVICGQYQDSYNFLLFGEDEGALFLLVRSASIQIAYYYTGVSIPLTGIWDHVELDRSGTNIYIFVNGVSQTLNVITGISTNAIPDFAAVLEVGSLSVPNTLLNGYLDEFRISKGIARHTSNFTPPTAPYSILDDYNAYSEPTIRTQGSYSTKFVAPMTTSLNQFFTHIIGPALNLTGITSFQFDLRASRTGSNIKLGLHNVNGTTTELTPNVTQSNNWQTVTWDLSAVTDVNKNAIDKIIITIVNADADNTFYLDNWYYQVTTTYSSSVASYSSGSPYASLSWSDDGGHTWSSDYLASMGAIGQYRTRLVWRRLGYSRDRVFRVAVSESAKKVLIGAVMEGSE